MNNSSAILGLDAIFFYFFLDDTIIDEYILFFYFFYFFYLFFLFFWVAAWRRLEFMRVSVYMSWSVLALALALALALVLASTGVQKYGNAKSGSVWYVVRSKFCVWSATGRLGDWASVVCGELRVGACFGCLIGVGC